MAVVTYRAAAGNNNAGGTTTIVATKPTGTADDDVLICTISAKGGTGTTITPPSTWTASADVSPFNVAPAGNHYISALGYSKRNGLWIGHGLGQSSGSASASLVASSTDGSTWTARTSPFTGTTSFVIPGRITEDHGVLMMTCQGGITAPSSQGYVATSTDGINWTNQNNIQFGSGGSNVNCVGTNGVVYDDAHNVWIVIGRRNIAGGSWVAFRSYDDGVNWAYTTVGDGTLGGQENTIVYDKNRGRVVSIGRTGNGYTSYSDDGGLTWATPAVIRSASFYGLAFSPSLSMYVAVGFYVYSSPDGITWTQRTSPFVDNTDTIRDVTWAEGDNQFMAVADSGKIGVSDDGINWTLIANSFAATDEIRSVAFGNGLYVAGANNNGTPVVAKAGTTGGPWRLLDRRDSTTTHADAMYWKRAKGEPASWTFTITSNKATSMVTAIQNADLTFPLSTTYSGSTNASSVTCTAIVTGTYNAHNGIAVMHGSTSIGTTWSADGTFAGSSPPDAQSASTGAGTGTRTTTASEHKSVTASTTLAQGTFTFAAAAVNIGHQIIVWEPLGKRPVKPKKPGSGLDSTGASVSSIQQAVNRSVSY